MNASAKIIRREPVAVVGFGCVTAAGIGSQALWNAAWGGSSFVRRVDEEADGICTAETRCKTLVSVPQSSRQALRKILATVDEALELEDPYLLFGLAAVKEALEHAGLEGRLRGLRVALCLGTAVGGVTSMEKNYRRFKDGVQGKSHPRDYHNFSAATLNRVVADCLQLEKFSCYTVATGCTAGLDSILLGQRLINEGKCDVALVGAAEAPLTNICFTAFDRASCLSSQSDPLLASCPFSRQRCGFVMGEGSAVLILASPELVNNEALTAQGQICGGASSSNAFHMTSLQAHNHHHVRCLQSALADSHLQAQDIDCILAHGTSTPQNDVSETNTIKEVLGTHARRIPISSNKSMFGHALGAAGAISSVLALLGLLHQSVTPTVSHGDPDPECDLDYVGQTGRSHGQQHALVNASGFSGIHTAVIYRGV